MRILTFINALGLGGTEKAACRWVAGLARRGHDVVVLALEDGPRRSQLDANGVPCRTVEPRPAAIISALQALSPDVIHAHAPGHPHPGDVLGDALSQLPKIPVVQTNIFGQLHNSREDAWTDFRLFISWTSCVQAARRIFHPLNEQFFRRASVASYPVDPVEPPDPAATRAFRARYGVTEDDLLLGRISRPDPVKWTGLALDAFRLASARQPKLKLLLREPPPEVADELRASADSSRFIILPATSDPLELQLTTASLDIVLHTSSVGESFGYGIAEPMNLGKPVVTHSVPSLDQAQIELVRHGECGFVASTPSVMAQALLRLANEPGLRDQMGNAARRHIRQLANPEISVTRLETALAAACQGRDNPYMAADLDQARIAAAYLDAHQFGHSLREQLALRLAYYRMRLHELRKATRLRRSLHASPPSLPSTERAPKGV